MLTCAFGSPWTSKGCGPCVKCQAEADRMEAQFWRGVFLGDWDETGRKSLPKSGKGKAA